MGTEGKQTGSAAYPIGDGLRQEAGPNIRKEFGKKKVLLIQGGAEPTDTFQI